jgi:hypothetical protein
VCTPPSHQHLEHRQDSQSPICYQPITPTGWWSQCSCLSVDTIQQSPYLDGKIHHFRSSSLVRPVSRAKWSRYYPVLACILTTHLFKANGKTRGTGFVAYFSDLIGFIFHFTLVSDKRLSLQIGVEAALMNLWRGSACPCGSPDCADRETACIYPSAFKRLVTMVLCREMDL